MKGIESLKEKLVSKSNIYASMLSYVGFTGLPRLYKASKMDFLVMDLEHGSFFPENIGDFVQACQMVDLPVIARVQDCEYHCISKPLDMGVDGILIPRTETMEQVEIAISSMRVPPVGKKGVGGRALLRPDENIYDINKNRLLFLQIESKAGVDLLAEMLQKYDEEIAGIIVGPCDMSVSLGCGLDDGCQMVTDQVRRVVEICRHHSKSVGMFMDNDIGARRWHSEGMNIFWIGNEISILAEGLEKYGQCVASFR